MSGFLEVLLLLTCPSIQQQQHFGGAASSGNSFSTPGNGLGQNQNGFGAATNNSASQAPSEQAMILQLLQKMAQQVQAGSIGEMGNVQRYGLSCRKNQFLIHNYSVTVFSTLQGISSLFGNVSHHAGSSSGSTISPMKCVLCFLLLHRL